MTDQEAGELLLDFPKRWESLQAIREQRRAILDEYKSAAAYDGARMGQGSHSDQTGRRAGRLVELGEQDSLLQVVRDWLTIGLTDTKDRVILTDLWRGLGIQTIIKRRNAWDIGLRWRRMTQGLIRFVGAACGEHGAACACIRKSNRRD